MTNQATTPEDWHPADIVAALKKNGWSYASLARHHGYSHRQTLYQAIVRQWPKGEAMIAEAIGVKPDVIWPSRYTDKYKRPVKRRKVNRRTAD